MGSGNNKKNTGPKEWFKTERGQKHLDKLSKVMKEVWTDEKKQQQSELVKEWWNSEEGELQKKKNAARIKEFFSTEEGKAHAKKMSEEHSAFMNEFWSSEVGEETRKKMREWHNSEEGLEHHKKIGEMVSGKNNHRYQAFKLIETTTEGEVIEYVFDCPSSPMIQAQKAGVDLMKVCAVKKDPDMEWVIKRRRPTTRHPFKKGSKMKYVKLDTK